MSFVREHYVDIAWLVLGTFVTTVLGWLYGHFGQQKRGRHE